MTTISYQPPASGAVTGSTGPVGPSAADLLVVQAFHEYAARVRGNVVRMTHDPERAADVTQETFLRLVIEIQAGRVPKQVGAWLYRASANLVVSQARRDSVARRHASALVDPDGPSSPDSIVLHREARHELQDALASFSRDERAGLVMAANGVSGAEIARHLGRSHGATRTMLSRSRRRLRLARTEIDSRSRPPHAELAVAGVGA